MEVLDRNNDEVVVACNPFLDATPDRRYEIRRRDDAMMMDAPSKIIYRWFAAYFW